jgi:hypothetical protein
VVIAAGTAMGLCNIVHARKRGCCRVRRGWAPSGERRRASRSECSDQARTSGQVLAADESRLPVLGIGRHAESAMPGPSRACRRSACGRGLVAAFGRPSGWRLLRERAARPRRRGRR